MLLASIRSSFLVAHEVGISRIGFELHAPSEPGFYFPYRLSFT